MKKYTLALLVFLFSLPILGTAQISPPGVNADIPFSFMVAGKTLPAGSYSFSENAATETITVMSISGKQSFMSPIMTRLSPRSGDEAQIVFDVVGTDHYLSEVFMPGLDGFGLKGAPGKHTHMSVKGKK
jgi:hypothetical protein